MNRTLNADHAHAGELKYMPRSQKKIILMGMAVGGIGAAIFVGVLIWFVAGAIGTEFRTLITFAGALVAFMHGLIGGPLIALAFKKPLGTALGA
ncbi:MAG TPA: hypothetical protein PKC28_15050 [Bdellovibrionales bacterium]|nr:hypothetical protein [Bdellovibrionales bacterium]